MSKTSMPIYAALALMAVLAAPGCRPANAQQSASPHHRAPGAITPADRAVLQARRGEIASAAAIHGYDLTRSGWRSELAPCAEMPDTLLLRYRRRFPDGAESVFVAAVPRAAGSVRIVPVLYRNATPFTPAPTNPRNRALFHQLVSGQLVSRVHSAQTAKAGPIALSACYAELTGPGVGPVPGGGKRTRTAVAPQPTVHLEPSGKVLGVTLATRESQSAYKLWSLSFAPTGQIAKVTTEDHPVHAMRAAPPALDPGWKWIPPAPAPPSKMIPPAPPPPVKPMPRL